MQVTRLFEYFYYQLEEHPLDKAYNFLEEDRIVSFSSQQMIEEAEQLAGGFIELGLKPGDKVAIVSYKNRPEWIIADIACQITGLISVPLYPTISANDYEYILNEAEVKYAIAGRGDLKDKLSDAQKSSPSLKGIYLMDDVQGQNYYRDIFTSAHAEEIARRKDAVKTEDLATIIYTSGTTGNPKGVMLSHSNIIWAVENTLNTFPIDKGNRILSFLPYCHIFERACYYGFAKAMAEVYCTGTDNLGGETGDLQRVKPHFFSTVPRLLEKVYEKIYNKGLELTGVKKQLFFWALSLTEDYEYGVKYSGIRKIKQKIADKLIFSKWREALGGNIRGIVTGAAPCPKKIAQVFSAAGIPIMEGYGLTETSPTLAINRFFGVKLLGSVGPAIEGVDLYIDSSDGVYVEGEGEILAKGPNIMSGYYKQPEKTAEVFKTINGERYFRTGDIGKLVQSGESDLCLMITDRKKELLKTSGGKYVAPAPIENKMRENFLIEQAMVVGDRKKFVSALIVPAQEALTDWAKDKELDTNDYNELLKNPRVIKKYEDIIERVNSEFSHIEKVKKFRLLPHTWDAVKEDGTESELTPTMKLKRRVILSKFENEIDELYV